VCESVSIVVDSQRLQRATEIIEKDDAIRDSIGLAKPTFDDLKDAPGLKGVDSHQADELLSSLGLASNPPGGVKKPEDG